MLKMIKKWAQEKVYEQTVDMGNVQPRLDYRDWSIFFNSCAGVIQFKAKGVQELADFRNKWANKFHTLVEAHNRGVDVSNNFFILYGDILASNVKIKYRANIRTRLRLQKCKLLKYI